MSEKIETNFEGLKDYDEIESYYDYLEQAENFYRDILGDRVESQKYIVRANRNIEQLKNQLQQKEDIIKKAREYIDNHQLVFELSNKQQIKEWFDMFYKELLEILDKENI